MRKSWIFVNLKYKYDMYAIIDMLINLVKNKYNANFKISTYNHLSGMIKVPRYAYYVKFY